MAQYTILKEILNDLCDVLMEMSASELVAFAPHWTSLKVYAEQADAQPGPFYQKLIDTIRQSPTLVGHRFPEVLKDSNRFSDEPDPTPKPLTATQGMPSVHNEIVRIAQTIDKLIAQATP